MGSWYVGTEGNDCFYSLNAVLNEVCNIQQLCHARRYVLQEASLPPLSNTQEC